MKGKSIFLVIIILIFIVPFQINTATLANHHIVAVVASYNNQKWYKQNLDSIFMQKYDNYHVIYIDDVSPDGTGELVKAYIKEKGKETTVRLICNTKRIGALANQYKAIHMCDDHDIIIIVDGDDWLAHENVFAKINEVYSSGEVWLTYGQFQEYPTNDPGFCCPMPENIVNQNAFRKHGHIPSHLRTFYAGLFKRIKLKDLLWQGKFLPMTGDIAAMFPMIEMARDHFRFIPEVLYVYNGVNPINDHKVSKQLQYELDREIRSRPRYQKLTKLFK